MEWTLTIAALAAGTGLAGSMVWLERRPRTDLSPRLVPTTPVMFAGILIAILALVHMLTLTGIELPPRGRF
jgi:hypothetical protein